MNLDLKFYLSIFLRRLPYFLIVAVLVSAAGISVALLLPAKYRAQALLLVEGQAIPDELATTTVRTGAIEQVEIIRRRLLTRPNLLEMAARLDVYASQPGIEPAEIVEDMRDRVSINRHSPRNSATTLTVSFDGVSARQSLDVTSEFVTQILQENVELRTGRATQTLEFFEQEVERLGADLDRQGAQMLAFKEANQDSLPDSMEYRRTRQAAQQERLLQMQRTDAALNDRRLRLVDLYERTGRVDLSAEQLSPEQRELQALQAELERALQLYSPQNPRIGVLQTRITALERTVAEQAPQTSTGLPSLFELQLAEIDGQLSYNADQRALLEAELEALRLSIEATPANAARLAEIEREIAITQGQYNQSVARLAQAQTGERIEVLSKGGRISVLEQAVLPDGPASPNRRLIAAGSLFAGTVLGLLTVLLLELLNRAVRRPVDITAGLGITPIATLPYIRTAREMMLRRTVLSSVFLVAVFGIGGGLYALDTYYMPMDLLLERIVDKTGLGPFIEQIRQGTTG